MTQETMVERVRSVAQAFADSGLIRLICKEDDFEVELRRAQPSTHAAGSNGFFAQDERSSAATTPAEKPDILASDLVGVLRFSRPFVAQGAQLDADRELAFVEALGIRNPVRSRGAGRVAAIFVSDGQPVEYGQPLFAIDR